jgi:hypothetical protein
MLPNVIIAGVPRAGTTSLFTWLADHPDVAASSRKETCYFVDPDSHSYDPAANVRDQGLAGYEAFFPAETTARVVIESTPHYIYQAAALQQLPDLPSRPKFIFILREPADQILSSYRYFSNNWDHLDRGIGFADFLALARSRGRDFTRNELLRDALINCDYHQHLQKWLDRAGSERVAVFLFEDLKRARAEFIHRLATFIGVDPAFYETYGFPLENYSYQLRSHGLHQLNMRIRELLPFSQRSAVWRGLRALYRRVNTQKAQEEALSPRDQAAFDALRQEFAPAYADLAARYRVAPTAAPEPQARVA